MAQMDPSSSSHNSVKYSKHLIALKSGYSIALYTSYPLSKLIDGFRDNTLTVSTCESPTYEDRLKSFENSEWKLEVLTPTLMAKAGFYYMGKQNLARCMFCSTDFGDWQLCDDPITVHKRKSPLCPYLKEFIGYDVGGKYSYDCTETEFPKTFWDSLDVVQRMNSPKHEEYANFFVRMKTFDKCEKILSRDITTFCESGLFYIGDGQNDRMLCFYCDHGIENWEEDDEPWAEHARLSPNCSYLLLNRGIQFVNKACGLRNDVAPQNNQEEWLKFFSDHKDVFSIPENNVVDAANTKPDSPKPTDIHQVEKALSNLSIQKNPSCTPGSIICKICFKNEVKVAIIPCCHIFSCIQCAMTIKQCSVCRNPYNTVLKVFVGHFDQKPGRTELSQEPSRALGVDPKLCIVCQRKEMEAALLPCRHVSTCIECLTKIDKCPICEKKFFGFFQVIL